MPQGPPNKSSASDRQKTLGELGWGQVVSLNAKQKDLAVRTIDYAFSKRCFIFISVSECECICGDAMAMLASGPTGAGITGILSCLVWVLGIKLRSSGRAVHVLNH